MEDTGPGCLRVHVEVLNAQRQTRMTWRLRPNVRAPVLTQHTQSGVGRNGACRVPGGAAVQAHVLRLDVHDEEDVVVGHDVHPALPGGGEIGPAVFLPGDLRCRVALGGALQSGRVTRPDGAVSGRLDEGRENCGQDIQMQLRKCSAVPV